MAGDQKTNREKLDELEFLVIDAVARMEFERQHGDGVAESMWIQRALAYAAAADVYKRRLVI